MIIQLEIKTQKHKKKKIDKNKNSKKQEERIMEQGDLECLWLQSLRGGLRIVSFGPGTSILSLDAIVSNFQEILYITVPLRISAYPCFLYVCLVYLSLIIALY